jgi:hypothetical protein
VLLSLLVAETRALLRAVSVVLPSDKLITPAVAVVLTLSANSIPVWWNLVLMEKLLVSYLRSRGLQLEQYQMFAAQLSPSLQQRQP